MSLMVLSDADPANSTAFDAVLPTAPAALAYETQ
jgi:hypothetical protein